MAGLNYLKLGSTLSNICNTTQLDNATKCHHAFKNFWGEPCDACSPSIPYKGGPKKRKAFPSSWLTQFDLLGFDEKRGTMHLMFYFNETIDID